MSGTRVDELLRHLDHLVEMWASGTTYSPSARPEDDLRSSIARFRAAPDPDRAAALRDVETLLSRVDGVMTDEDDGDQAEPVRFTMTTDRPGVGTSVSPADLAALIVDRVLGGES